MFDVKKVGTIACACICTGSRGRLLFERPWRVSTKTGGAVWTTLDSKPWQYSVTRSLEKHSIMGSTAISLNSDSTQIKLSIDIHCYSNVWRSICIAWRVLMPSWHNYHRIGLVLGTILQTIHFVYLQLPGGNPPLPELQASQSEQWRILYPMTSVACAFSTARRW